MGDIIESKIGPDAFKVDIVALLRWFKRKQDPVTGVASRFLQIFQDHGVSIAQIPQFFPQLTFDKLKTPDALLPALNADVLEQTAKLFGIQRSWLEGVEDTIYKRLFCHRNPAQFFEDIAEVVGSDSAFPVHVLYTGRLPSATVDRYQPLVLILEERLRTIGREEIRRYRIYGDGWDWNHYGARIQLKAMIRTVHLALKGTVPLHHVPYGAIKRIGDGKRVPREHLQGCVLTEPRFEDYVLSREESGHARECEELPAVFAYIEKHQSAVPQSLLADQAS